jgi:lysozyme
MRRFWPFAALAIPALVAGCSAGPGGEQVGELEEGVQQCDDGGAATVVEGVDVYDGQGTIDWTKVKAAGRDFAFIKATQGDYNTQKTFAANWSGTKAAGIFRSPYHFFDPTIDGVAQANHFLTVLSGQGGLQPGDLPPMLDIECPVSSSQTTAQSQAPNCEYTGNDGWVATATLVQRVFDWLATVEQATGRKAIIYSYPSWFADVGLTDARLAGYPLYIATLSNTCASVPAPWMKTVFWQYSFTGTVSGIPGTVDLDRFMGTLGQLGGFADGPDAGADGAAGDAPASGDATPANDGAAADGAPFPPPDAGTIVGEDGGSPLMADASSSGGCSCREARTGETGPAAPVASAVGLALALALAAARRRRRPGCRAAQRRFGARRVRVHATSLRQE